jgi:hypothetical protein
MSSLRIEAFLFDGENEEKIGPHSLSASQVVRVLDTMHVVLPNRKERHGLYVIIGRDNGGACIPIPVESTHEAAVWPPITSWYCKRHEQTVLKKSRRKHE